MNVAVLTLITLLFGYCLYFAVAKLKQRKFFVTFYVIALLSAVSGIVFFIYTNRSCEFVLKYKVFEDYVVKGVDHQMHLLFWQYVAYDTSVSLYVFTVLLFSSKYLIVSLVIAS